MQYYELTDKIIACAYKVYNKMGFGYAEAVYENCMMIELRKAGIAAESQKPIQVYYDEEVVGDYYADICIENKIIIELKSVRAIHLAHEVQLVNYLTSTGLDVGLIINFGPKKVDVKRKVRILRVGEYGQDEQDVHDK